VALFARRFSTKGTRSVELGIGDDAAVLGVPGERLVVTVDASVEGTHFERAWLTLEDIGFRAFQAAASDLAAMGARPLAAVSALNLPRGFSERELASLTAGQAEAARACRCPIVGGNVARGAELCVTTTVLGTASRPLTRGGAKPGDDVWLVGEVGLAAAGLSLLQAGEKHGRGPTEKRALAAWRRPQALLGRGIALVGAAHAAVDVSDGLAVDAGRIAQLSACRLVLEESALRGALPAELELVARRRSTEALVWALTGGEDYALVAAGPRERRPRWARRIGRCEKGRGAFLDRSDGAREPLVGGFDHFTRSP